MSTRNQRFVERSRRSEHLERVAQRRLQIRREARAVAGPEPPRVCAVRTDRESSSECEAA